MRIIAVLRHDLADGAPARHNLLRVIPERDAHGNGTVYGNLGMAFALVVKHLVGVLRAELYTELLKDIIGSRLHRHVGDGLSVNVHAHALHILRQTVHRESTGEEHHPCQGGAEHRVLLCLNELSQFLPLHRIPPLLMVFSHFTLNFS